MCPLFAEAFVLNLFCFYILHLFAMQHRHVLCTVCRWTPFHQQWSATPIQTPNPPSSISIKSKLLMRFNKRPFRRFSLSQLFVDIRYNSSKSFVCPVTSGGETPHTTAKCTLCSSTSPLSPRCARSALQNVSAVHCTDRLGAAAGVRRSEPDSYG